jgi:hypothetical protein
MAGRTVNYFILWERFNNSTQCAYIITNYRKNTQAGTHTGPLGLRGRILYNNMYYIVVVF